MERLQQEDPLLQAQRVRRQKSWNHLVAPVNYLSRSAFSLVQGNMQVLVMWAVDGLNRLRQGQSRNEWDRKMAALYAQHLEQEPNSGESDDVRQRLERLADRDRVLEGRELLALSDLHRRAGDPRQALYYAQQARATGASAAGAELKASQDLSREYRDRDKAFTVLPEPGGASDAQRRMLELLAWGSPEDLDEASHSLPRPEALTLQSVAAQMREETAQARRLRDQLAGSEPAHPLGRQAEHVNRGSETDSFSALQKARAEASQERWAYILHGSSPARDELAVAQAGGGIRHRGAVEKTLSALFFPDAIVRGLRVALGAGPTNEPVRDAAARYVAAEPDGAKTDDLERWLARQAEKRRDYDMVEAQLDRAGTVDPKARRELNEKKARDLFARIQQVEDPRQRQRLFEQARPELAGTRWEKRAIEESTRLQKQLQVELDRAALLAMPSLTQTLNWPREWFDGDRGNGELAEQGVVFIPPDFHEAIAHVRTPDGSIERRRQTLNGEQYNRVQAILRTHLAGQSRLDAADALLARKRLPLDIQGGLGSEGLSVYPSLQPYRMNEAEAPLYR